MGGNEARSKSAAPPTGDSKSQAARGNPTKGDSKSLVDSNEGRFVAIRRAGSKAPASASEHDLRPALPCAEDVRGGNSPSMKGSNSQEEEASDARGDAPQQRADSFPFATPAKSNGQRADSSSPSAPISARKVPQQELASYSMPVRPNRQLTKRDLGSYDFKLLNAIKAVANSAL